MINLVDGLIDVIGNVVKVGVVRMEEGVLLGDLCSMLRMLFWDMKGLFLLILDWVLVDMLLMMYIVDCELMKKKMVYNIVFIWYVCRILLKIFYFFKLNCIFFNIW